MKVPFLIVLCVVVVILADKQPGTQRDPIKDYRARLIRNQRNRGSLSSSLQSNLTNELQRPKRVESHSFPSSTPSRNRYNFGYVVKDRNTFTAFERKEKRDGNVTEGSYRVNLPDGRLQIVSYRATPETGNVVNVTYVGEARYPPYVVPKKSIIKNDEKVTRNSPAAAAATYSELEARLSELEKRSTNKRNPELRYPAPAALYRKSIARPLN